MLVTMSVYLHPHAQVDRFGGVSQVLWAPAAQPPGASDAAVVSPRGAPTVSWVPLDSYAARGCGSYTSADALVLPACMRGARSQFLATSLRPHGSGDQSAPSR